MDSISHFTWTSWVLWTGGTGTFFFNLLCVNFCCSQLSSSHLILLDVDQSLTISCVATRDSSRIRQVDIDRSIDGLKLAYMH